MHPPRPRNGTDPLDERRDQVPLTSVSAPQTASLTTASTAALTKAVDDAGLCTQPGKVTATTDPWFPPTRDEQKLEASAKTACHGCPVVKQCLELALRQESQLIEQAYQDGHGHELHGIFGGRAPHERRELIRVRLLVRRPAAAVGLAA